MATDPLQESGAAFAQSTTINIVQHGAASVLVANAPITFVKFADSMNSSSDKTDTSSDSGSDSEDDDSDMLPGDQDWINELDQLGNRTDVKRRKVITDRRGIRVAWLDGSAQMSDMRGMATRSNDGSVTLMDHQGIRKFASEEFRARVGGTKPSTAQV